MRTAQRWYIYVMAYASLVALTSGVINVASVLIAYALGLPLDRDALALWAGVLVVALPLHVAHALWADGRARQDEGERRAELRKVYTYTVAAMGTFVLALYTARAVRASVQVLLGGPVEPQVTAWITNVLSYVVGAVWGGVLVWNASRITRMNGDYVAEVGRAASWRRLYVMLTGVVGLFLLLRGITHLGQALLVPLVPMIPGSVLTVGRWWPEALGQGVSLTLVGLGLWRWAWGTLDRWGTGPAAGQERLTIARQVFYYAGVAMGLGAFLLALAQLLRQGLIGLLGGSLGPTWEWWPDAAQSLALLPVGAWAWHVHRARVLKDVAREGMTRFHLAVGRFYTYVISAVGMAVTWAGAVTLIRVATLALLGTNWPTTWWREATATGLAMVLVAAPVWLWHWRQIQMVAWAHTPEGAAERASRLRRVYLYGVSLVAGLIVLVFLGQVAHQVWLWILGEPFSQVLNRLASAAGPAVMALAVWAYHMRVLRRDGALAREGQEDRDARRAALLAERERLRQRLAEIEEELARYEAE